MSNVTSLADRLHKLNPLQWRATITITPGEAWGTGVAEVSQIWDARLEHEVFERCRIYADALSTLAGELRSVAEGIDGAPSGLAAAETEFAGLADPKPEAYDRLKDAISGAGDLTALRAANIKRQAIWCPDEVPDLSFRGLELGGEVGEAQNVMKKLERERLGWRGSRDTLDHLAEELADVVICADLCALSAGVDLAAAVVSKFNATSEKVGIDVKLSAPHIVASEQGEAVAAISKFVPDYAEWMDKHADDVELSFYRGGNTFGDLRKAHAALRASLNSSTVAGEADGYVLVPQTAIDWLTGSGPDANGNWFGEVEEGVQPLQALNGRKPGFWWRSHFLGLIPAFRDDGPDAPSTKGRDGP